MVQLWSSFFDATVAVGTICAVPLAALHPTTTYIAAAGVLLALLTGRIVVERAKVRYARSR